MAGTRPGCNVFEMASSASRNTVEDSAICFPELSSDSLD